MLDPDNLSGHSPYTLWSEAGKARLGVDRRFIQSLLDRPDEALRDTLRFCLEDRSQDAVPLTLDLIHFFRRFPSPDALPFLMAVLEEFLDDPPEELVDAFVRLGRPAVGPLLDLLEQREDLASAPPAQQEPAADDSLRASEKQGDGSGPVHKKDKEQALDCRPEICFLLASLGVRDERIRAALEQLLAEDPMMGVLPVEIYADPALRPAVERALAALPGAGETADAGTGQLRQELRSLLNYLENPAKTPVLEPFDILAEYPERAAPPLWLLPWEERLEFLESPDPLARRAAAHAFHQDSRMPDAAREKLLLVASQDPDEQVRGACWEAFSEIDLPRAVRDRMLHRLLQPGTPEGEKAGLIIGLASMAANPPVREVVLALYEKPEFRAKALEAMWRSLDRSFSDYMPRHLDDPEPDIRMAAIHGVGYLGISSAAKRLEAFLQDPDFRSEALAAYALAVPFETSRSRIHDLYRTVEEVAGGLSEEERQDLENALDLRLHFHGLKPVFHSRSGGEHQDPVSKEKIGRNDPCPCGSGRKYKKCCGQ